MHSYFAPAWDRNSRKFTVSARRDHAGRFTWSTSLEGKPDINPAVLGAGTIAIAGCGEKAVVAAGRCMRVIVTILGNRIRLRGVVVLLGPRASVIAAIVSRHLVVMVIWAVLCAHG
jgi:hypothetical protein